MGLRRKLLLGAGIISILLNMYVLDKNKTPKSTENSIQNKIYSSLPAIPFNKIVLDPGHVGEKGGATQPHGIVDVIKGNFPFISYLKKDYVNESDITWDIANNLAKLINKNSPETAVYFTARKGEISSLQEKVNYAKHILSEEGVLLSIHVNYGSGNGVLALYSKSKVGDRTWRETVNDLLKYKTLKNIKLKRTKAFVNPILDELNKLGFKNQGLAEDARVAYAGELAILRNMPSGSLATLLEVLNIDNPNELAVLKEQNLQLAKAIYCGLARYQPIE